MCFGKFKAKIMEELRITKEIEIIELEKKYETIPKKELPQIWYDLIIEDKWPKELGTAPDSLETSRCWEAEYVCRKIQEEIGHKAFHRYMKVEKGDFTDQMFDDWWESRSCIDKTEENVFDKYSGRNQKGQNTEHSGNYILSFAFGFLFALLLFVFKGICS